MNADEIRAELATVSWFPQTEMAIDDTPEGPRLTICAVWPDASDPDGSPIQLRIESHIPPCATPRELLAWLDWRLCRIAVHEHGEWFRLNGQRYRDPGHAR